MISSFPDGNPPLRNRQAGLLHAGGHSPLGERRTGGISAFTGPPRIATHTFRPGPRPTTTRQATAILAQNARVKREVDQTLAACEQAIRESDAQAVQQAQRLAFSSYDFDKRKDGVELTDSGGSPLNRTRFRVGSLWVLATSLSDYYGDHRYFICNPQTGAVLEFTPEASLGASQQLYASKGAQFRGIAAATGRAGEHMQLLFGGTAAVFLTGGVALEYGAYAWATEQAAPLVSRVAVQAWRVAQPAVQAYAKRAAKGVVVRMGLDAGFQFGTGYLAAEPGGNNRMVQAANGVNGTSVVAAGLISVGEAKTLAKFLVAFGSSATTNLVTVSGENSDKYQSIWHTPNFHDSRQTVEYVRNVILGTLFDQSKEYGSEWVAKRLAGRAEEWAAQASGRATKAALKWVTETRVALPASFIIGGVPETLKKRWENNTAAEEEAKARAEKAKAEKAATALRRASASAPNPKPR